MIAFGIPVMPLGLPILSGPIPTRPIGLAQTGTTKKLCLCNLQREKDAERAAKKNRR